MSARAASAIRWDVRPFIGGQYHASASPGRFANIDPSTEEAICEVADGAAAEVDHAVAIARRRFDDGCWSRLPGGRRLEVLMRLADLIEQRADELAVLDSLEMGRPISAARQDAQVTAPRLVRNWAGFADKLLGESAPLSDAGALFNVYEPRGVVGAITPWNFPLLNAVFKIAPALAAGNCVVVKPSELSASSCLRIAEYAIEAGVPEGVLNVVPGLGVVGAMLAEHSDVDMVSFTGSTATGRRVMTLAGQSNGKPLLLECGGKSPHIIFDDLQDVAAAAAACAQGILANQGQICSAHTRVILHDSVRDAFLPLLIEQVGRHRMGDALDEETTFGPLASPAQRDRVAQYLSRGEAEGAGVLLRGSVRESGGCFVSPAIFDRVAPDMAIAREEIFGPVLAIQTFRSDEEAIALANGTEYGLSGSVWTADYARGIRMARSLRTGSVAVRSSAADRAPSGSAIAAEPQRGSGFGSETGLRGLQSYSTLKRISLSA